ncbi:MAG: TIM barrel protein [Firmicutes bacterium]|nr:TIM barrel protein [Bacillota bacterium]
MSAFADEAAPSLEGQSDALKRNGLSLIDVRTIDGKNIKDMTAGECRAHAAGFRAAGIGVNCVGSPVGKVDIGVGFAEYTDQFKSMLEKAFIFGTDKIRLFSFYNARGKEHKVFDFLNTFTELAAAAGIRLYHENEHGVLGEKAEDVIRILDNVPGLNNLFDAANYVLVGEDIGKAVKLLAGKTDFFHIKDARVSGEIVPAGKGDGLIAQTLSGRADLILTLEPHLYEFAGLAHITKNELKAKNRYQSPAAAFDAGAAALRRLLQDIEK